jgi:glycosyltransferase involved in cell wall biosynthesis
MIRVAILADFPLSALTGGAVGRGGGQGCTWLPQLALAFEAEKDLDIHWIVFDRKERKRKTVQAHGQTFHLIPGVPFSVDLALNYLPARYLLKRIISKINPDIVHAWGTELIYPAALQDFHGPRILSMQGVLTEYARIGGLPDDWRWRKMVASEADFIRSATIVTSESQWGIDKVKAIHPSADCRMVEYGVHPSFYDIPWQPKEEPPYALFVGGIDKRKGVDLLIEALTMLPERAWEMRFAGDPAIQSFCDAAGLFQVKCLGSLPWPEMQKQLQGAWCSILPTRGDTSANSVKEARVIGVPVIASAHGGHAGYIKDGINGLIVDPLTPKNLAAALDDVMSCYSRAHQLGKGRYKEDRVYLNSERTAQGFSDIYRSFKY